MSEKNPERRQFDGDLEQLSTIEEPASHFGIGGLDSESAVSLKDWSAQDFANSYVRFRPHLMIHARRFLANESQVEEVVQDAFLYLMTALPELDSELGVLRFLKWKTKMLCIDVIRASERNRADAGLSDDIADATEPHQSLERAEDAAIIMMALAKLSPRHREALVSTLVEERSYEEVARDLGLDKNALRQLLYRARAAFREALVGQSEVDGKSISEILSVAARKASKSPTAIIVGLASLAMVVLPMTMGGYTPTLEPSQRAAVTQGLGNDALEKRGILSSPETPFENQVDSDGGSQTLLQEVNRVTGETEATLPTSPDSRGEPFENNQVETPNPAEAELALAREKFNAVVDEQLLTPLGNQAFEVSSNDQGSLIATSKSGWTIFFSLDTKTENVVQYVLLEYGAEGNAWKAVPMNSLSVVERVAGNTYVSFAATDFLVGDFSGSYDFVSTMDSGFSCSGITLDLIIDDSGAITSPNLVFLPST